MTTAAVMFQMLADPTRRRLVEELREGERSVGELVSETSTSQPGVSRHLRLLLDAGVVQVRAEGQRRLYSLRAQPFRDLERWMEDYRDLVESRLDRVEELLDAEEARARTRSRSSAGKRP